MIIKPVFSRHLAVILCALLFSGVAAAQSKTVNGITISDISFPDAQKGVLYTYDLAAATSGPTLSDAPYTYAITANELPSGIKLSSDGLISGISCGTLKNYNFNLQVTSAQNVKADFTFGNGSQPTLLLTAGPNLSCSLYVYLVDGSAAAGQGDDNYTFSIASGSLPPGVSMDANGVFTGTPTTGGDYTYIIKAVDGVGRTGFLEITENLVGPAPAPTGLSATAGNGQATISFSAPSSNGGSAITNYEYSTDGGSSWTAFSPAVTSGPVTITGLTNGTAYNIQLRAINASGVGAASASVLVTPAEPIPASEPSSLSATAGNGQATISFSAPASNGGSAITNYEYSTDGGSTWIALNPADGTSPVTIGGLSNGTAYNIQLRAVTIAGAGAASASVSVTPAGPASTPTDLSAAAGNGQATISFSAPSDNGGSAISNYEYSTDGGSTWIALSPADGTSPVTVGGLSNGTAYNIQLRAVTAAGAGAASSSISMTPVGPASAPTALSATAGNGQATISFTAPASNGGSVISNYEYSTDGGETWTAFSPADGTSPVTVGGLSNGTAYNIQLRAVTTAGSGAASASISVTPAEPIPASEPTSLSATAGNGQATISFSAPSSNGGSVISNYEYSTDGGETWTAFSPADGTSPVTVGGLTNGTAYSIQLRAVTIAGAGAASANVSVTPAGVAAAPTGLSAAAGDGKATISFSAPSDNGGSAISNYEYSSDGGKTWTAFSPAVTNGPVTVNGLTNGTAYNIQLRAVTAAGAGAASASVSVTPTAVITASAPTGLTAMAGDGQATISFSAPSDDGGSAITGYRITASPGGITATGASSPITVSGLTNGTSYTFTVVAITAAGDGAASVSSNAVTPQTTSTISGFPNLDKTWGDAVFTLTSPTSNSEGAFTYSSSDTAVATINGNVVTITGVGVTTITATQAASGAYKSGSITATLSVAKAAPAITWMVSINKTFGNSAFDLDVPTSSSSGAFTYSSSNTAVATVNGNTVTIVGSGTTTLTASQAADSNHLAASAVVTLTVGKAEPTLTWLANIVKTYGEQDFTLANPVSQSSGTFTFRSSNTSVAIVSGNKVSIIGAGTAVLTATQAESGNYATASVTTQLLVNARPDPSRDPGVTANLQAQVDASSRFALTQQMNIRDRLRQVRGGSNANSNGISLNLSGGTGPGLNLNAGEVADAAAMNMPDDWSWWTAGVVQFGDRKSGSGSDGFEFRSDGLTFGLDRRVGNRGVVGATFGRGWNDTEFNRSDSSLAADYESLSIYGMFNGEQWYIDGLVGYGGLDFEIHRYSSVLDDYASGIRSGSQLFGSLTMGYQSVRDTIRFTGYARVDASHTTLDAYRESGFGIYDLSYAEQTIDSSTVSLGLESGHQWITSSGIIRPYWMFEYRMALDDHSGAGINYAYLPNASDYVFEMTDFASSAMVWGAGLDMDMTKNWILSLLYRGERLQGDSEGDSYTVGLKLTYRGASLARPVDASPESAEIETK